MKKVIKVIFIIFLILMLAAVVYAVVIQLTNIDLTGTVFSAVGSVFDWVGDRADSLVDKLVDF